MDATPAFAWIAGRRESLLNTAVFATTDAPPELIPGGADDYQCLPAEPSEREHPVSDRPPVRWRPRQPAPAPNQPPEHRATRAHSPTPVAAPTLEVQRSTSDVNRSRSVSPEPAPRQPGTTVPRSGELQLAAPTEGAPPSAPTRRWQQRPTQPAPAASQHPHATTSPHEPTLLTETPAELAASTTAAPLWIAASRGVATFLGLFTILNVLGEMRHPGFDANLWWIDLRPLPPSAARALLALAATLLLTFGLLPALWSRWRGVTLVLLGLLLAASVWNTATYYRLLRAGTLHSGPAVPFSMHASACLIVVLAGVRAMPSASPRPPHSRLIGTLAFCTCLLAFPLAQMQCFGHSDYRRPADVVVVFGCGVNADGTPSPALIDRVTTGCRLYHDGLAGRIILSGGPGPGNTHETDAMHKLALDHGVPPEAIELDPHGVDTAATVANTAQLSRDQSHGRILAVSHTYHLPRIKLCYRRAGLDVFTVPATQQQPLQRQTWYCVREMAALWWYYARPLADR